MGTEPALTSPQIAPDSLPVPDGACLRQPVTPHETYRRDLSRQFDRVFCERPAVEEHDIRLAFRLRYQVYCLEKRFEDPGLRPDGLEWDQHDANAYHCLLFGRAYKEVLGTVRLVRPPLREDWLSGLPLAAYAQPENLVKIAALPSSCTAEVSRFAISCAAANRIRFALQTSPSGSVPQAWRAKLLPIMSLGLVRGLVRMSVEAGITHWCLAAEPSLLRRLRGFGLHFKVCGPPVEYRGVRLVCYERLETLLERAAMERPGMWEIMTQGGRLQPQDIAPPPKGTQSFFP